MAQLRVVLPALGTIVSAFGVNGATANHYVDLALSLVGPISYGICAVLSLLANTQTAQVMTVRAMPGVQSIEVNTQASQALAAMAVDPTIGKVNAPQAILPQITAIAKGSS
jgi:hypothetical protein